MLDLTPIKERCEKATPGPWKAEKSAEYTAYLDDADTSWIATPIYDKLANEVACVPDDQVSGDEFEANLALLANARTDIPALIAEVERLRAENEQYATYTISESQPASRNAGNE